MGHSKNCTGHLGSRVGFWSEIIPGGILKRDYPGWDFGMGLSQVGFWNRIIPGGILELDPG